MFDADPIWDAIRTKAADKALALREQGFSGPAMLGMNELEYTGVMEILSKLEPRFKVREDFKKEERQMDKLLRKEQEVEKLLHAKR